MRKPLFFLNLNRLKYNKLSAIIVYCRIYIFHCLTIAFILTIPRIFYLPSFVAHETFLNYNSTIYNFFVQCGNNFFTGFCFVVSCATNPSVELQLGFIRRPELKPNSEQKDENILVAPPYCQTACCAFVVLNGQLFCFWNNANNLSKIIFCN